MQATSALDGASENLVREALERLMKGRTTLVIAHRTSTLASAQRILVLNAGKVAEEGEYSQLVKAGGLFARLAESLPQ